jgi:hypothetical protein
MQPATVMVSEVGSSGHFQMTKKFVHCERKFGRTEYELEPCSSFYRRTQQSDDIMTLYLP